MGELCLMASHGYPLGSHSDNVSNRLSADVHHFFPYHGSNQELAHPHSFNLSLQQKEELKSIGGLFDLNHLFRIESTSKRPTLVDFQGSHSDSALLSFGIAEQCVGHEKFLKLLSFKSTEEQSHLLDYLTMLYDLVGPQSRVSDFPQQMFASYPTQNLIQPTRELYFSELFLGEMLCSCTGIEMNYVLSVISWFYSSKNTNKSTRQTMLVPYFERRRRARSDSSAPKLAATETASLKSHDKVNEKTSQKKKTNNNKAGKERDIYSNSYLHACESLLSIIANRNQQSKNVILSLKKSGPQLHHLLTQVSASIAGTGIAVVLSVLCGVAFTRVPFCTSRVLSTTGLGLGLVWLSWAVNKLRNTVITISKSSGKVVEEDEMMSNLDDSLKDIYVRVAALLAVVVLKVK